MDKDDLKVVGFAGVICVICSLLLSATASVLRERQELNVELDRKLNVLKAFGVAVANERGRKLSEEEVDRYFQDHISEILIDRDTGQVIPGATSADIPKEELKAKTVLEKTRLPLYLWKDEGEITKYAFPTSGMGLWSVLYGYLALDRDLATVVGITFYKNGETPGLGAEVASDWFQDQFRDKKIYADGELLNIEVVKGAVEGKYPGGSDHAVDGISGATMTGNGINTFLNRDLQYYEKYFRTVRGTLAHGQDQTDCARPALG